MEGTDIYYTEVVEDINRKKAWKKDKFTKSGIIMLNITGGGKKRIKKENTYVNIEPHLI